MIKRIISSQGIVLVPLEKIPLWEIDINAKDFSDVLMDKENQKFTEWDTLDKKENVSSFLMTLTSSEKYSVDCMHFGIKKESKVIGFIYLYGYSSKYRRANIGICLSPIERELDNYVKSIFLLIAEYMKVQEELDKVSIQVSSKNSKEIHFIKEGLKCRGFKAEGILKNYYGKDNHCIIYSFDKW